MTAAAAALGQVAVLGMYDFPELRSDWNALYRAAACRVDGAPPALRWDVDPHESWLLPHLAIGMACGWPLVKTLRDQVRVIGTFSYAGTDGPPHIYRSAIVARDLTLAQIADAPAHHRAALNSDDSLSGSISLLAAFDLGFQWPGEVVYTGSHVASIEAVRSGAADVAAIDAMTWAYRSRAAPETLDGLTIIGHGPLVPCLPLIVPATTSASAIIAWREGLAAAIADPELDGPLRTLMINDFVPLDAADYETALAELVRRHLQPT